MSVRNVTHVIFYPKFFCRRLGSWNHSKKLKSLYFSKSGGVGRISPPPGWQRFGCPHGRCLQIFEENCKFCKKVQNLNFLKIRKGRTNCAASGTDAMLVPESAYPTVFSNSYFLFEKHLNVLLNC